MQTQSYGKIQHAPFPEQGQGGSPSILHPESPFSKGPKHKFMHQELLSLKKTTNPSESPNSPRQLKDLFSDTKVKKKPDESISPKKKHP